MNPEQTTVRRAWWYAAAVALAASLLPLAPPFALAETATEDLRFLLRGPRASPSAPKIVLAVIDDATRAAWREPTALWGDHFAAAFARARACRARVVGLDVIPTLNADDYLAGIVAEALRFAGRPKSEFAAREAELGAFPRLQPHTALLAALEECREAGFPVILTDFESSLEKELRLQQASSIARVDVPKAPDGALRAIPYVVQGRPYLATALAEQMGERPGRDGAYGINYVSLVPDTAFPRIPLHVLADPRGLSPGQAAQLDGAAVLIGEHHGPEDVQLGVLRRRFFGSEIQAHALASLLDHRPLRRLPAGVEALVALAVAAAGLALLRLTVRFAVGAALALALALAGAGAAQWAFARHDLLLPLAAPLLALALPLAAFHLVRAADERRTRLLVEQVFGQYLSPAVRDYLMEAPENRALGGRTAEATVLFFDLRGSIAFAEGRSPEAVLTELNRLFGRIVPILQRGDGTVLHYMGDGFLAVFGAPSPRLDHARAAVAAVAAVRADLALWNAERERAGEAPWRYGIGLHSGPVVWGSVGAAERPELTLIGDAVNVAARLQEASKALGATVVMSETTWRAGGHPPARGPIAHEVRGRQGALSVYVLEAEEEERTT